MAANRCSSPERDTASGSELGGLVAATIELHLGHVRSSLQVTALVTNGHARRSGAARLLMDAAMAHAVAHRCAGIELTCALTPRREAAHRDRSLGYEVTSYRYWLPTQEDVP